MSDETRVGAALEANLNLGDYNNVKLRLSIDDTVRQSLDDGKTSRALDRLVTLLDAKLEAWAKEYKNG